MNNLSNSVVRGCVVFVLIAVIAGCSSIPGMDSVLPDRKVEYKKSRQAPNNLEVPPDLTTSSINNELVIPDGGVTGGATLSSFQQAEQRKTNGGGKPRSEVLPEIDKVQVRRDDDQHWLEIQADPEEVWFSVVDFWQENGILLEEQDPAVGVMVTDWLEERPNVDTGVITGLVSKLVEGLHVASTRDQYRVRIEPGERPDVTEVYLTHRGMQETILQDSGRQQERAVWNPRPTDHGLEAEMLRRLMVYLGVSDQQATRAITAGAAKTKPSRSRLNKTAGDYYLSISEDFDQSWRLTGVALDRVGFAVEDRDRGAGIYYVRYNDPLKDAEEKGWLSKLAFWGGDDDIDKVNLYQVILDSIAGVTKVEILNEQGDRDNSETALRILTLLNEQIR